MTDETLDKLLQEFLIHKDPAYLKEYMADRSMVGTPTSTAQNANLSDSDGGYSLISDHSLLEHEPQ